MTFARASQAVAEVIRKNTAPKAQASQVVAEVIRKQSTAANARVSQVVAEVLRKRLPDVQVSQAVAEILRAERILSASATLSVSASADLMPGLAMSATGNITLDQLARLELGTELPSASMPVAITGRAALQVESRFAATLNTSVTGSAHLQKGIELNATAVTPVNLRAALKVHPKPVTGFFLLF